MINKNIYGLLNLNAISLISLHLIRNTRARVIIRGAMDNKQEESGGGILGLRFVIAFRNFFRVGREGPLGVTRILRAVSLCRLRHASLLSLQVDCIRETERTPIIPIAIHVSMHPHKYAIRKFRREIKSEVQKVTNARSRNSELLNARE